MGVCIRRSRCLIRSESATTQRGSCTVADNLQIHSSMCNIHVIRSATTTNPKCDFLVFFSKMHGENATIAELHFGKIKMASAGNNISAEAVVHDMPRLVVVAFTFKTIPVSPPSTPIVRTDPTDTANSRGHRVQGAYHQYVNNIGSALMHFKSCVLRQVRMSVRGMPPTPTLLIRRARQEFRGC